MIYSITEIENQRRESPSGLKNKLGKQNEWGYGGGAVGTYLVS
jgi:hypothetical protein